MSKGIPVRFYDGPADRQVITVPLETVRFGYYSVIGFNIPSHVEYRIDRHPDAGYFALPVGSNPRRHYVQQEVCWTGVTCQLGYAIRNAEIDLNRAVLELHELPGARRTEVRTSPETDSVTVTITTLAW